ncbi:MAG: hypothetical protein HQ515_09450 [Phycisphaeraceae bacterium]|nr:hypothetical protein [Phycisphaeraceae bacterium]
MGLFSSSSSSSSTTNKDNSIAIEGDNENIFLSPESSYSPTWNGDVAYGLSSLQVGGLLDSVLDKSSDETAGLMELNKNLASTMKSQTDKLTDLVESLKTDGTSWMKWLPFALIAAWLIYQKVK